ncbi:MAG: hypothetical protein JO171_13170 [Paludibacterium sp.]|uniref:hypothetical protein n=1 Tax=Paludibacterium sp. TaxID=1917523 RepID=UPI0026008D01|nr:hypothetical protein [Paludibacterium sp.]MBV8048104.1 hypothetical protein [Paludibacterium sp.]MBV8647024.1 hypothetical protein [Paludibacterium sp.]
MSDDFSFHRNKMFGAIAETTARAHFELLGYDVDLYGIEHTAPLYVKNKTSAFQRLGLGSQQLAKENKKPDFIISRLNLDSSDRYDAIMVEAKFRVEPDLRELSKEMMTTYQEVIDAQEKWVLFYLLARGYRNYCPGGGQAVQSADRSQVTVFLMHAQFGWWVRADHAKFDDWPLYRVPDGNKTFREIYQQDVLPALSEIFD